MIFIINIILLFLIILLLYIKKDSFTIIGDSNNIGQKDISETYVWPCSGCLNQFGLLKPKFSYTLSDSRCLKNKSNDYTVSSLDVNNIMNYNITPDENKFISCDSIINTLYSTSVGRFILITNSKPFIINYITIKNKQGVNISATFITYNDTGIFAESIINSTIKTDITSSYLLIDLRSNVEIGQLILGHSSLTNASTLIGSNIVILFDYGDFDKGKVVSNITISDIQLNRLIYTQNNDKTNSIISISKSFNWPCTNCLTKSGLMYRGFKYTDPITNRCFMPNNYTLKTSLDSYLAGNTKSSFAFQYFNSCNSDFDSRFIKIPLAEFRWDATLLNSLIKPDFTTVMSVGDQIIRWVSNGENFIVNGSPAILSKSVSTTDTSFPGINLPYNSILNLFTPKIKLPNRTIFIAMKYKDINLVQNSCIASILFNPSYFGEIRFTETPDTVNGSAYCIFQAYIKTSSGQKLLSTATVRKVYTNLYIFGFAYNSTTDEYKISPGLSYLNNSLMYMKNNNSYISGQLIDNIGQNFHITLNGFSTDGVTISNPGQNYIFTEILSYNTFLSDDDCNLVTKYLQLKWL
jgi:hypothetical protein